MSSAAQMNWNRLHQRKAQLLPWIADPLTHVIHNELEEQQHFRHASEQSLDTKGGEFNATIKDHAKLEEEIEAEEASSIELFYDLFFVANLTTVTSVHYMVDKESLTSYILFFVILWFTWLQTSLYDIRFSVDSFYERTIKAIHFFVMIGLASVSTSWEPFDITDGLAVSSMKTMSLTLTVSRFALAIQYAVTMIYARKNTKPIAPFAIHFAVMFAAGFVYLGVYIAIRQGIYLTHPKLYLAWYFMILAEVVGVVVSSSKWKVVSFKRTHLVERMGLLSLIILGEGIIVMLKAVNTVEKGTTFGEQWNAKIFFVIGAAVLVIYFLYMFYFDYTPKNTHYGTIRQQIWAVLHFPFHLAVVISVEGLRQLTTWYSFQQAVGVIDQLFLLQTKKPDQEAVFDGRRDLIYNLTKYLYTEGSSKTVLKHWDTVNSSYAILTEIPYADLSDSQQSLLQNMTEIMTTGFAEFYGIKVSKKKHHHHKPRSNLNDPNFSPFSDVTRLYDLVYEYFFIAIGVVFIMYGVFGLFVRRRKDVWDYISVAIRFTVGITFFGIVFIRDDATAYNAYYNSSWPVPSVCLILAAALFLDKYLGVFAYKRMMASHME